MINLSDALTGKFDSTLNGITDYISKKAENLTRGFVRSFTLSTEEKMTFINDVYIDLCFNISDSNPWNAPTHNLDNNSIIAETVMKKPTIWSLECQFTSPDHAEKYDRLLKLADSGNPVTLLFGGKVIENLIIMSINRNITKIHYTSFTITLTKLNFVKIATIPAPEFKKIVAAPVKTISGKAETQKTIPHDTYGNRVGPVAFTDKEKKDFINLVNPFDNKWGGVIDVYNKYR